MDGKPPLFLGRHRDAHFAPTVVMRRAGGVFQRGSARIGNTTRGDCAEKCNAKGLSVDRGMRDLLGAGKSSLSCSKSSNEDLREKESPRCYPLIQINN